MPILLVALFSCLFSANEGRADSSIRLKTRTIDPLAESAGTILETIPAGHAPPHLLLQFHRRPTPEMKAELARRGIRVLHYVPENAVLASASGAWNLEGLDLRWAGPLPPAEKLSPALETDAASAWLVIFHPDVAWDRARLLVEQAGLIRLQHPDLLPGQLIVAGPEERVRGLAALDEVAYVLPASADLASGNAVVGCAGPLSDGESVAEYAKVRSGWALIGGETALAYTIGSVGSRLPESTVRSEIARALDEWAKYARLRFTPGTDMSAARTVAIRFASGAHGDPYPFDGPGKVLAHTFYPAPPNPEPVAGDMHLDEDEDWRTGAGVDLFTVVLHEAGHALGLGHSDRPGSVMYPYYRAAAGLGADDIAAIRDLYGERQGTVAASTPPTTQPPAPPSTPVSPPATAPPPAGGPGDNTPPAVRIQSPALTIVATSAPTIAFRGAASDNVAVKSVTWSTSSGASGQALGTMEWSAPAIPLLRGNNMVTVRAWDAAGNSNWRAVTVVRR